MSNRSQHVWTAEEVMALGVRTSVPVAGEILAGLCKDEAYRAVKRGTFPVPVYRCGRRMVVPVASILELLHIEADEDATGPARQKPIAVPSTQAGPAADAA
jgi:hypothetical protein